MTLRRSSMVVPSVLVLGLLAGTWGYTQYRDKRSLEIQAENQYARAFQELSFYMDGIEMLSAKALVSASRMQRMKTFSDIWRNSYAAQAQLGQLPLTNVPLKRTQEFLARLQAFTYDLGMRNLDELNRVSEKEWNTLNVFHKQSRYISAALSQMNTSFAPNEFKWTRFGSEVASALVGGIGGPGQDAKALGKHPVVKSFVMLEDGLSRMPSAESSGEVYNFSPKPKFLVGPRISVRRALQVGRGFLGPELMKGRALQVKGRNSGDIPSYTLQAMAVRGSRKPTIYLDVTQKGGHVMWMLNQRGVRRSRYDLEKTKGIGLRFLEARGLDVIPVAAQRFENIAVHSYATYYGGYVVYPELIKVQVACDNGEILGVDSVPYLTFHDPNRQVVPASFTQSQAQTRVDRHLKMNRVRKAVILNDRYDQVACYEFEGGLDGQGYRVYINTANLDEEKVERNSDVGYEPL